MFYDELKCEWDIHSVGDVVMCLGYFNGQVDGCDRVHEGFGVGQRNMEGRMLLGLSGK